MRVAFVKPDILETSTDVWSDLRISLQHLTNQQSQVITVVVENRRKQEWGLPYVADSFVVVLRFEGRATADKAIE